MKLVIRETGTGARWVVMKSHEEIARERNSELESERNTGDGKFPLLVQTPREKWGTHDGKTEPGSKYAVSESQNPRPVAQDATSAGHPRGFMIPWLCASVDPSDRWWERLRGNPKRAGEISQAAFLLKAEMMGFDLALPWGDNQKFDFVVWRRDGRAVRVQVKGTGRLHRRGYEVQPVHTTRRGGKKRYTKKDIDVIAAHVQPVDAWYLIPIEKVGRAKSLRLYPGIERRIATSGKQRTVGRPKGRARVARWEGWRDRWEVLETGGWIAPSQICDGAD